MSLNDVLTIAVTQKYHEFSYSNGGVEFDIVLTHTYQIPVDMCATECDKQGSTCNVFEVE